MRKHLETYFEFAHLGTNWRTEILAGVTTFLTMAYIVLVNPAILSAAGVPLAAATAATCLSAAFGSILMGIVARYPIALAPGMGLNAYFTYTVVKGMGVPWQAALGAVFISGVAFLLLTVLGVRQLIISTIPYELYAAVAAGVGLFIALLGFRNSGIVVPNAATTVTLGNLDDKSTALAIFGLLLIAVLFLQAWFTPAPPDNSSHRPRNGFNGWGCPPGRTYHWYVSNGQWKADARTAVAILQYVLSPLVQGALKH